jgi:hypothetical protein
MPETGGTAWTIYRPGSNVTGLTDLASELQVLGPESIDIKPDSCSIVLNFASGKTKLRPYINGSDNKCLEGSIWFLPYCKPPVASATQSEAGIEGDLFTIDPTDGCVSRIENTVYQVHAPGKVSLHNLCLEGRIWFGGDLAGGTQVKSTKTPGLFHLQGAKFTPRKYLNPNRPTYQASLNAPTILTNIPGSQNSKRSSAADTESSKRRRPGIRKPRPSVASSRKAAGHAIDSSNNPNNPGSLFQHLEQYVRKSIDDLDAPGHNAASHSLPTDTHPGPGSRFNPDNTIITQQGNQGEYHSHEQTTPSQSALEQDQEKLGEMMWTKWVEKFYSDQSQDSRDQCETSV